MCQFAERAEWQTGKLRLISRLQSVPAIQLAGEFELAGCRHTGKVAQQLKND